MAILLPDLRPGGAERLHLNLAAEWLRMGYSVEFVLRRAQGVLLESLPPGATVFDLGAARVRDAFRPLVRYLRESRPDVLLAAMWPLTVVAPVAARVAGYRGRVVVSEHSPLSRAYADRGRVHRIVLCSSMRLAYPLADARIAVSAGVADDLSELSGLPRAQFDVIHNPAASRRVVDESPPRPVALEGVAGPVILTVGTLKKVKRHDLLINAFARLQKTLDATLCIIGEGPQRATLEKLIEARGLAGRVLMPGYSPDPTVWYAHADLFVLSSDYEGFGNVIVEAMEHGVPVVSTDCPSGPSEILEGGHLGRLVPVGNADKLAEAIEKSLSDTPNRDALKVRARDFAVDVIAASYISRLLPELRSGSVMR